jgi:hypothetical protein
MQRKEGRLPVADRTDVVRDFKTDIVRIWRKTRADIAIRDRKGRNLQE